MASAPVPVTNVGRGYTVITQVLPSSTAEQNSTQTISPLRKFLKGEPKALGTVQIMIGLLTLLFGIVLAALPQTVLIVSGMIFWSPVFHITAGSLAVSASNKLNSCVVKATLTLNIFSTLSAGITIMFLIIDMIFGSYGFCEYENSYGCNYAAESMSKGITGVLLVFTLLQFCISIALSAFACKAICTSEPTLNIINVVQNPESFAPSAPVNNPFPPHHTQQEVNMMHGIAMATAPGGNPPAYSEKM